MSRQGQTGDVDFTRTQIGLGAPAAGAREPRELPGRHEVQRFPWAAGLGAAVFRDFTDDLRAVANLRHPHLAAAVDAGCDEAGVPFLVRARLPGQTLAERLVGARGTLSVAELLSVVRGVASALSAAHAAGIAHGELGIDSVFIIEVAGYPHGLCKLVDLGVGRLTAAARAAGRALRERPAAFVAPEQRADGVGAASPRADQFALAGLAYRLLTVADPRRALVPDAPAVESVLARAMSFRPEERFDSVAAFFVAFETSVLGRPPSEQPASSLTQQFFAEGDRQEAEAAKAAEPIDGGSPSVNLGAFDRVPRRRAPLIVATSVGVAALAIVAWSTARPIWGQAAPRVLDTDVLSPRPGPAGTSAPAPVALAPSRTASSELRRVIAARHVRPRARPQTEPPPLPPAAVAAPAAQAPPTQAQAPQPAASPPDEETDEEMAAADRAAQRAEQVEATPKTTDDSAEKVAPVPTEQAGQ
jgi:serine/threonine-protein kinase